jgi:hypothetical protein
VIYPYFTATQNQSGNGGRGGEGALQSRTPTSPKKDESRENN